MPEQQGLGGEQLPIFYMRMRMNQVHARLGKLKAGQVVPMDQATATRFLMAGAAEQASSGDFDQQSQQQRDLVSARQQTFYNLNQNHSLWDVSTHRDVLTASDDGLRAAYDAGMPLANLQYLRTEDDQPLDQDSDIEEILEARQRLHANDMFPLEAHDRSSVMGGGSQYQIQGGPQPLTPKYREVAARMEAQQPFAHQQHAVAADRELGRPRPQGQTSSRQQRAGRRAQTLHGSQGAPSGGSPPQPGISPEAGPAAREAGVKPPEPPSTEQKA